MSTNGSNPDVRYPDIQLVNAEAHTPDPPSKPDENTATSADWESYERAMELWRANEAKLALYHAIRHVLPEHFGFHEAVKIPANIEDFHGSLGEDSRAYFITIIGILIADNMTDPLVGRANREYRVDGDVDYAADSKYDCPFIEKNGAKDRGAEPKDRWYSTKFVGRVVEPVRFYSANKDLFRKVVLLLEDIGTRTANGNTADIYAEHVAEVGRRLIDQNVSHNDPHLKLHVETALSQALGGLTDGRSAAIDINLPDLNLDDDIAADIDKDNVMALAAIYFAAQLEELRFFAVADKVAEQFMSGMIPISRGPGGETIYDYIRNAPNRFTEIERRSLYSRCFGIAGGAVEESLPNREFNDLWIRFLSAVSLLKRQSEYERELVTGEQVHKAARDLGVNLSVHGYGVAHFAAVELQTLINDLRQMLRQQEILAAYGVRDVWQLIERVSNGWLGGSINGVRQRTMAQSGAKIMQFIGRHAATISGPFTGNAKVLFTTKELVVNVEQWLAVTGTTDQTVDQYSEPVSQAKQPTIPTLSLSAIPDQMQKALDQVGGLDNLPPLGEA